MWQTVLILWFFVHICAILSAYCDNLSIYSNSVNQVTNCPYYVTFCPYIEILWPYKWDFLSFYGDNLSVYTKFCLQNSVLKYFVFEFKCMNLLTSLYKLILWLFVHIKVIISPYICDKMPIYDIWTDYPPTLLYQSKSKKIFVIICPYKDVLSQM